jgi:hypothetical protein
MAKRAVDVRVDQRREPRNPITLSASVPLLVNTDSVFLHFMAYKGGHETRDAAVQWLVKRTEKLAAVEKAFAAASRDKVVYTVRQRSPEVDEQLVSGSGANPIKVYNASFHFAIELSLCASAASSPTPWDETKRLMRAVYTKIAHDVGMKLIQRRFLYEKNVIEATAAALAKATHVIRQRALAIANENRSRLIYPAFATRESRSGGDMPEQAEMSVQSDSQPAMMATYSSKPRSLTRSKRSGGGGGGGDGAEEIDCDDVNVELLFQQPPPIEILSSVTIVYETEACSARSANEAGREKK